jgi:hypothetical protein
MILLTPSLEANPRIQIHGSAVDVTPSRSLPCAQRFEPWPCVPLTVSLSRMPQVLVLDFSVASHTPLLISNVSISGSYTCIGLFVLNRELSPFRLLRARRPPSGPFGSPRTYSNSRVCMSPTARMRSVRSDGLIRPFHSPTVVDGRVRVRDRRGRLSTHYKSVALSTDPNDYAESALLLAGELDFLMSTRARARRTHPPRIVAGARWVRMRSRAGWTGAIGPSRTRCRGTRIWPVRGACHDVAQA